MTKQDITNCHLQIQVAKHLKSMIALEPKLVVKMEIGGTKIQLTSNDLVDALMDNEIAENEEQIKNHMK